MAWRPVLRGETAIAAQAVLAEIMAEMDRVHEDGRCPADVALFWAYAAGASDDAAIQASYDAAVAQLLTSVDLKKRFALHQGLAGTGWILSHLSDGKIGGLTAIDDQLIRLLDTPPPWTASYDLLHGVAGLGIYFLERLASDAPRAADALRQVVHHLGAVAETTPAGTTWFSTPQQIGFDWETIIPRGCYNCGVAHGVPGIVAMLARVAVAGAIDDQTRGRARTLAIDGIRWVRSVELPLGPRGRFPNWIAPDAEPYVTRPGWCYGDPGIAVALWAAAMRLGEPVDRWIELAREFAHRPVDTVEVMAPGICHGAMGLAHLVNRCFQATGEAVFADAANAWVDLAIARRAPARGPAGFHMEYDETSVGAQDLLGGVSGIGLVLLAGLGTAVPDWDRLLGCDLPVGI